MKSLLPRLALASGNFITGLAVLAPAGMLHELSNGLGVTIRDAGLLVTYGAVILCFGSPILSWLTTRMGRRLLLTGTLVVIAIGNLASAFAADYATILLLRIAMLVVAAIYTPQAASTIALLVPEKSRPSALAFVFLGWSIAIAVGLPLVTLAATHFGWRETYLIIGIAAAIAAVLNVAALPRNLQGYPLSLQSFAEIARSKTLLLILLITLFQMSGQFSITIYLVPVLSRVAEAGPAVGGIFFSILGIAGIVGNVIATSIVGRIGVARTLTIFMLSMMCGSLVWAVGGGVLPIMAVGVVLLGLGLTSANSMQQARLIEAAPTLASATVALNTSFLYFGQALGSASAGFLFDHGAYRATGFLAVGFFVLAFVTFQFTEFRRKQNA